MDNECGENPTKQSEEEGQITRRQFCNGLIITSAGLVLAQSVHGQPVQQGTLVEYPPFKIDGAEKLLPGSGLYFDYPGPKDPAVLVRTTQGEFAAYNRKCSHAGCSVEFDQTAKSLKCPCHKGAYDARVGDVVFGPPRKPLEQIVLQIRTGGQVWAVGKIIGRTTENIT